MAANPQYDDLHGVPMTEEAFEHLIGIESPYRDEPYVEIYRRAKNWRPEYFSADQTTKLDQLDLELPLPSIYEGVFE